VVQPLFGWFYMRQIQNSSNGAFQMMMQGPRAWEMLWVVGLISALILTSIIYLMDRREIILNQMETRRASNALKILLIAAAISGLVLITPGWIGDTFRFGPNAVANPFGNMKFKYIALGVLAVVSAVVVFIDTRVLKDRKEKDWGKISRSSKASAIFAGVLGMWVVMAMGFVRESARQPWVIWNIIPVPGGTAYPTPISLWSAFIIWGILLGVFLIIFWFLSKVTAEQPSKEGGESEVKKSPPKSKAIQ